MMTQTIRRNPLALAAEVTLASDAPERYTPIHILSIRTNGSTQMRAELNQATIAEYAAIMQEAQGWGPFPPVDVYYDGDEYWLADGFHRVEAARDVVMNIPARVLPGGQREAILHAAGANASHGLRRTNADKRRAVETLLRDEDWAKWSDREIARKCNVSDRMVNAIRAELSANNSQMPTERMVQRGETIYSMNTSGQRDAAQRRYVEPKTAPLVVAVEPSPFPTITAAQAKSATIEQPEPSRKVRLSPCPFCGGSGQFDRIAGDKHFVECRNCSASGPVGESKDEAATLWNVRIVV